MQDHPPQTDTPADPGGATAPRRTEALNTILEDEFVSPLTAMRGALEILRDHDGDLDSHRRHQFVMTALNACARIESGVNHLSRAVYGAARQDGAPAAAASPHDARVHIDAARGLVELDFSGLCFSSAAVVNDVFNAVEHAVRPHGRKWAFLVNHLGCTIWPEAWVAFAHRSKRIATTLADGVAKYAETPDGQPQGREIHATRAGALAELGMREGGGGGGET